MKSLVFAFCALMTVNAFADDISIECKKPEHIVLQGSLNTDTGPMTDAQITIGNVALDKASYITTKSGEIIVTEEKPKDEKKEYRQYIFSAHVANSGDCIGGNVKIFKVGADKGRKLEETESCTCDVD